MHHVLQILIYEMSEVSKPHNEKKKEKKSLIKRKKTFAVCVTTDLFELACTATEQGQTFGSLSDASSSII